jgi:choline dehydrogenase-like flavoprotein
LSGTKFSVRAKLFILAAGGIENARLLLLSNERQAVGLGNQHDLVGRFFLEHPAVVAGIVRLSNPHLPLKFYQMHNMQESLIVGGLTLSPEVRRRERLVTVEIGLDPVYDQSHTSARESKGVRSLGLILKALWNGMIPDEFGKHVGNVLADIGNVAVAAYGQLRFRGDYPPDHIRLTAVIDPAPNRDSRVTLARELDQLGKNRVQLDWRLSPIDKRSVRRTLEIIGVELGRAGIGRLQIGLDDDDTTWPADPAGASHHMGTTRMHDDHKRGVVDQNCQVHGIANLFVAGSSVFPTAGSGTPTLMIVALAIRLADHIKGKLR